MPPSKTLRGTTLLLFLHSALKTRSDPPTPPRLQPVQQTQRVALLTAFLFVFLLKPTASLHVVAGINVASLKSAKMS